MGVVVALVLSVASRSLSDTVLSRQEREGGAVFSVAETGVEKALNALRTNLQSVGNTTITDSSGLITGNFAAVSTSTYTLLVKELDVAQLDLTGFSGNLAISWTKKGNASETNIPAAIEVIAINPATSTVVRSYYNPYNVTPEDNKFEASSDGGADYVSTISYNVLAKAPGSTILRIRPIYAGATLSVAGLSTPQLYVIQSSASGGDAQKDIQVKRGLDAPPSVFDFAVFAGGTIIK